MYSPPLPPPLPPFPLTLSPFTPPLPTSYSSFSIWKGTQSRFEIKTKFIFLSVNEQN